MCHKCSSVAKVVATAGVFQISIRHRCVTMVLFCFFCGTATVTEKPLQSLRKPDL